MVHFFQFVSAFLAATAVVAMVKLLGFLRECWLDIALMVDSVVGSHIVYFAPPVLVLTAVFWAVLEFCGK